MAVFNTAKEVSDYFMEAYDGFQSHDTCAIRIGDKTYWDVILGGSFEDEKTINGIIIYADVECEEDDYDEDDEDCEEEYEDDYDDEIIAEIKVTDLVGKDIEVW